MQTKPHFFILFVLLFGLLCPAIEGWSGDAHRVIARIASEFLRDTGKNFVAEHLTDRDTTKVEKALIEHSTYADTVEWSDDLHFSHTPYRACDAFEMVRDCPLVDRSHRCIVTAIANYTMRASNVELSVEDRAEAIKFLIHLIGDIHNPLHVGFAEDRGGTQIRLSNPSGETLHSVWDDVLVHQMQVELGVFDDLGEKEESKQPWKLSDAVIPENSGMYKSHMKKEDVSTEEAATSLAASMASKISLEYTCNYAYKKDAGQWIENGDDLSQEGYLETRSRVAMELMKFAGIRLAELLNKIGKVFSTAKHELKEKLSKEQQLSSPPINPNIYVVLDIDFDPEAYIFGGEAGEVVDYLEARRGHDSSSSSSSLKISKGRASKKKGKRKDSSDSKITQIDKTDMFEGVDLNGVILAKFSTYYYISSKQWGVVDFLGVYFPCVISFSQNPASTKEIEFRFDARLLGGNPHPSKTLIARIILKIRNVENPETILSSIQNNLEKSGPGGFDIKVPDIFTGFRINRIPEIIEYPSLPPPSAEEKKRICFYRVKKVTFFVLAHTFESNTPIIKTKFYKIFYPELHVWVFDERLLINEPLRGDVLRSFNDLQMTAGHELSRAVLLKSRRSIIYELDDLNTMMFGTEPGREDNLKSIKWLAGGPAFGDENGRLQWSTQSQNVGQITQSHMDSIMNLLRSSGAKF